MTANVCRQRIIIVIHIKCKTLIKVFIYVLVFQLINYFPFFLFFFENALISLVMVFYIFFAIFPFIGTPLVYAFYSFSAFLMKGKRPRASFQRSLPGICLGSKF